MRSVFAAALVLLLAFPAVSAQTILGGETVNFTFARCDFLTVNITDATLGEWTAVPNCTEATTTTLP